MLEEGDQNKSAFAGLPWPRGGLRGVILNICKVFILPRRGSTRRGVEKMVGTLEHR